MGLVHCTLACEHSSFNIVFPTGLDEWLADEDTPFVDNTHVNFSALHVTNPPAPGLVPLVQTSSVVNPAPPRATTNLWDAPLDEVGLYLYFSE